MEKKTSIILVVALAFLAILYAVSVLVPERPYVEAATIGQGVKDFNQLSERFRDLADKKGGVYAYEVLRRADLPPGTDLHLLGHAVGEELYKQKGVGAIAYCTQDFRNACSHSVAIGIFNEFGANNDTIKKIDDACHQAPGGSGAYTMCYHGLGHGVFAYFGYDLPKTVAFCKKMGTADYTWQQYTQCVSGAIMELMGGGGHDHDLWVVARQKYLSKDPLAPCDTSLIPADAKNYCYIYITPRLFEVAGNIANPTPDIFTKAFTYCDVLTGADDRSACFGGFGKEFIPLASARDIRAVDQMSDDSYAQAAGWCDMAAPQDGKEACIEQAVESVFWGGENDPAASFRFCSVVPAALGGACYNRLGQNIDQYMKGSVKERWCAMLPAQYTGQCKDV